MARLEGKVAVVTAAGRGTGRTRIIALDVEDAVGDLALTAPAVTAAGRRCITASGGVHDLEALTAGIGRGVSELGRLDVVVANAGIHAAGAPTWEITASHPVTCGGESSTRHSRTPPSLRS